MRKMTEDFDPQNIDNDPGVVTKKNLPQFKIAYDRTVQRGGTSFLFAGRTVLVDYAKYVLQYMGEKT